jgi:hypothetical protein
LVPGTLFWFAPFTTQSLVKPWPKGWGFCIFDVCSNEAARFHHAFRCVGGMANHDTRGAYRIAVLAAAGKDNSEIKRRMGAFLDELHRSNASS